MLGVPPKTPRACGKDDLKKRDEKEPHGRLSADKLLAKANNRKMSRKKSGSSDDANRPAYLQKIGLVHRASNQPIYDDEYYENLAAEKMVEELIQYLKDNWKVVVDKKSSLIEITYRTLELMYHKQPVNHWLIKRARQKISDFTGFFSNVRKPYDPLGLPILDTPTLIFNNLPERLKIESLDWFLNLERREEEEKRRNAPLPKLPPERMSRPKYGKGRIRKGAGGTEIIDDCVHTTDRFQKEIRGSLTFTKLLSSWNQAREDEAANQGSPFGVLHRGKPLVDLVLDDDEIKQNEQLMKQQKSKKRLSSTLDDRVYQHQMLHLEKMMTAMYNMIKSLLNMKTKHLKSQYTLPLPVVISLRERSPETRLSRKKVPQEIVDRAQMDPKFYKSVADMKSNKTMADERLSAVAPTEATTETGLLDANALLSQQSSKPPSVEMIGKRKYKGTGHVIPKKLEEEDVHEVLPLDDVCDTTERKENIKLIKSILKSPSYLDDRPPELKSVTLKKETPEEVVVRDARNDRRFRIIFDRKNIVTPEPQWFDVRVESTDLSFGRAKSAIFDDKKNAFDFAILDFSGRNKDELPFTAKRPNPDDIPEPRLPNSQSVELISPEEQSRLNLLAKCPGADSTVPLPQDIQRLFRESGIKNTTRDMYQTVMKMKKAFNDVEKKLRTYYVNEVEKFEWETMKRYKNKIGAIYPSPIYEWSIGAMRRCMTNDIEDELNEDVTGGEQHGVIKRPSIWYKSLLEKCQDVGAIKHHGCKEILIKLHKYCDIDTKTRTKLLNRFCLLVLSLPTTELGTPYYQEAVLFLLDQLFGSPKELFYQWLAKRGLPVLV